MEEHDVNRRQFNKLTMAAFGGLMAGTLTGCPKPEEGGGEDAGDEDGGDEAAAAEKKHVCRGLNACDGKGAGGDNSCAGKGNCASAEPHTCKGENKCSGQGGCGENPGANTCSGKGACAVPLKEEAWKKARAAFEEKMKADGKTVGEAPAAPAG